MDWATRLRSWAHALRSTPEEVEARREGRAFYFLVLLVLAGLSALAVRSDPGLREPGRLAALAGLVLVHGVLHWRSPLLAVRPGVTIPYLLVQAVLAVAIVGVSRSAPLAIGLFPALVGVAAGTVRDKRIGVGAAVAYLGLQLAVLNRILGWNGLPVDALMSVLAALFAVFFALAYRKQADARQEVQLLVGRLTEAHDRIADYALRIEDQTLAAERQRMARELHDTLVQGLAGLVLQMEAAVDHLGEGRGTRAGDILGHALTRARETLVEARDAIAGLRETDATPSDLQSAIRIEVDRFTRASGIPCRLDLTDLPRDASGAARRIVAEALANVAQHARAGVVSVRARCEDGGVGLVVEDDGVGFDAAVEGSRPGHYGLIGMRERARVAGGHLSLDSAPGGGARVHLWLPARKDPPNG